MSAERVSGIVVRGEDAEVIASPVGSARLFAEGEATDGAFSAVRFTLNPGADGAAPHHHTKASELFFVIAGTVDVLVGDEIVTAGAGDLAVVNPNTAHAFANASQTDPADVLIIFGPAIERFDYFRLLRDLVAGKATRDDLMASQERFDNWFGEHAAWAAHRAAARSG
jgi:mannose-6-phosphate isomerase-like protein (cupin superfamily)